MWEGGGGSQARPNNIVSLAFSNISVCFCFGETLLRPRGDSTLHRRFALAPTQCSRELLIWKTFKLTSLLRVSSIMQVVSIQPLNPENK